jgi:GGDEF domain-containing protein
MAHEISARSEAALLALFPVVKGRTDAPSYLVDQLVEAELHRRGIADVVSGASHVLALTQGPLMKEEYDLSAHAHGDGWHLDAVLLDPLEFTLFNMHYGFSAGDAALKALVAALKQCCPQSKVVRTHTDGFAILFGPSAGTTPTEETVELVAEAAQKSFASIANSQPWKFTTAQLSLTIVEPQNWQVLGPLVFAECERALFMARRSRDFKCVERRIELHGRLPSFDE